MNWEIPRWALRVSNPQPSPCKGEEEMLVRGLSSSNGCHRIALVYLGVLLRCYAGVMQEDLLRVRWIRLGNQPEVAQLSLRLPSELSAEQWSPVAVDVDASRLLREWLLPATE
jgi:hypothetical protein